MSLQKMWATAHHYARIVREKEKDKCEGRLHWNTVKEFINTKVNFELEHDIQFKKLENEQTQEIMSLPEYKLDESGIKTIEMNHFMIQTVRIPNEKQFSIQRLIQIAFNIGQFVGMGGINKNLPRVEMNKFISDENIVKINAKFL